MRRTKSFRPRMLCTAIVAVFVLVAGTLPKTALATQESVHLAHTAVEHVNLIAMVGCLAAAFLLAAIVAAIGHVQKS